jgi:hypothetical protein
MLIYNGGFENYPVEFQMLNNLVKGTIVPTNFGPCRVLRYVSPQEIYVEFIKTKYCKRTSAVSLRRGTTRDPFFPSVFGIGYVGDGEHASTISGKASREYRMWQNMLARCYGPKAYEKCRVVNRWHCFQNFAEDIKNIHGFNFVDKDGNAWELDKDLLSHNKTKRYSPTTCCFLPQILNVSLRTFCEDMSTLGKYKRIAKIAYILSIMEDYEKQLDRRVVTALKNSYTKQLLRVH